MMFRGVGWAGLQNAKALAGAERLRIAYTNGDLLLIRPGLSGAKPTWTPCSDLVKEVGRAFRVHIRSLGEAFWERPQADAGKMLDAAFYAVASAAKIA